MECIKITMTMYTYSGEWDDIADKFIKDLNSCLSLRTLNNTSVLLKNLVAEINQLKIFFDCQNGCGMTRISLKLFDGTEIMSVIVEDVIGTVPDDMQHEILNFLLELCQKAIECIDERIPILKKTNETQRRKTLLYSIIFVTLGTFLEMFHTNIINAISENLNIENITMIDILLKIFSLIFLLGANIYPLQLFKELAIEIGIFKENTREK